MRPTIAGLAVLAAVVIVVPPQAYGGEASVDREAARGVVPDDALELRVELRFDQTTGALVCVGYRAQDQAQDGLLRAAMIARPDKRTAGAAPAVDVPLHGGESDVIMMALPQYGPETGGGEAARRGELDAITLTLPTDGLQAALRCKHGSPMG